MKVTKNIYGKKLLKMYALENKIYDIDKKNSLKHTLSYLKHVLNIINLMNKMNKKILIVNPNQELKAFIVKKPTNCFLLNKFNKNINIDLILSFDISKKDELFKICKAHKKNKKIWINFESNSLTNSNAYFDLVYVTLNLKGRSHGKV